MHTIGPIVRLQIQRSPLKVGEKPNRRYDPEPLLQVERVRVTPDGIIALHQGAELLDVHHTGHPQTRNSDGLNGLSVGFSAHYTAMTGRFGTHMWLGCAGENMVVASERRVTMDELANGFVILDPAGRLKLEVGGVQVARPCRPFSGFALGGERVAPEVLKETLQFLDDGIRGFYGVVRGVAEIVMGDVLAVA